MSTQIIEKYKSINPINNEKTTHDLMQVLVDANEVKKRDWLAAAADVGRVYLVRHDSFPGVLIEYTASIDGHDSVTTMYSENPVFQTRQALLDARREIIQAIEYLLMAVPGTTVVRDNGRERECHLYELGTAQLLDTLIHFNQTSPAIVGAT